jgi:outer membrane lipoprotein-sorting protein
VDRFGSTKGSTELWVKKPGNRRIEITRSENSLIYSVKSHGRDMGET